MLMSVKCSAVTSVAVTLTYDDNYTKNEVISLGDIIAVEFNKNGCRRRTEGKVIFISASGNDPKNWYIIIDRSEDFDSAQVRFCPQNILDIHIIKSASTIKVVKTPNDRFTCPYIRVVKNRLQFSIDGVHWKSVMVDPADIEIRDEGGTEFEDDNIHHHHHRPHKRPCKPSRPHYGSNNSDENIDPDYTIDPDEEFGEDNNLGDDSGDSSNGDVDHTLPDIIIDNSL